MKRKPTAATEDIQEEADYVNSAVCTVDTSAVSTANKTAATSDQKCRSFTLSFSPVAVCWVILIIIMALRIYFMSVISENNTLLTAENQELTNIVHELNSTVYNLTVQFDNLNKSCTALETNDTDVTAEYQELKTQNQQLGTQVKNLTDMLQDMETEWNELNVSRTQWSIDQYCPIEGDVRKCKSCQAGGFHKKASCFEVNDAVFYQKTWDEAQADCKGKIAELAVINNTKEKDYIREISVNSDGIDGYWIGLRAVDGKWTWVDGSDLTEIYRMQLATPTEGHCAISVWNRGLKSVSCSDKNAWICEKQALSLTPPS